MYTEPLRGYTDTTHIFNKLGSESIGVYSELKKKNVTKIALPVDGDIVSLYSLLNNEQKCEVNGYPSIEAI